MLGTNTQLAAYVDELNHWRHTTMENRLRDEDGWLALVGLHWLHEGRNTIGKNPTADIVLENERIPDHLGSIELVDNQVTLTIESDVQVTVDGETVSKVLLRPDNSEGGPSLVQVGSIIFFYIRRGDEFGIRVRDLNNPARLNFTGRKWFPVDLNYKLTGKFIPHAEPRTLQIVSSTGHMLPMSNPGRVEFTLHGQTLSLEAFAAGDKEVWFVFKDKTSAVSTYGAGRFLYAPLAADGTVTLDFNRAYNPPCAFTPYATCPRPPKENILPVEISAGEYI